MGFFSRLKQDARSIEQARDVMAQPGFADMVSQAQEAYAGLQGGGMQAMMAQAQRASTLATSGIDTPATIRGVETSTGAPAGGSIPGFGPAGDAPTPGMTAYTAETKLDVEVHPQGKPTYEASFTQTLPPQITQTLQPGMSIVVRVDPNDPMSMLYWGGQVPGA